MALGRIIRSNTKKHLPMYLINIIHNVDRKFYLFLLVGGMNTLFGYSIFALLIFLEIHYTLAAFISTCVGILFNFKTTGKIVFQNTDNTLLFKFVLVYCVLYIINILILKIFTIVHINLYIGGAIAIIPIAVLGFILNKNLVFTHYEKIKKIN